MAPTRIVHHKGRLSEWYSRLADFKVEDLFSRKREPGPQRTVFVNENLPQDYFDNKGQVKPAHVYATNQVITSKYTVVTFLPRNLLEQFRRVANIFFLFIAILQFFTIFSTISPGLVILPLVIVLGITALKDGYEDIKRHQSDRTVNNNLVRVLGGGDWVNPNVMQTKSRTFVRGILRRYRRKAKKVEDGHPEALAGVTGPEVQTLNVEYDEDDPAEEVPHRFPGFHHTEDAVPASELRHDRPHWKKTAWEDLAVGDFVKIMDNESLPADILICATSEEENVCFVETKNLDGETNLKSRNAVPALTHLASAARCAAKENVFRVDCERPDTNMYKLSAAVRVGGEQFPGDISTVLLRGTVLRNTKWVIGLVLYTGEDTKIVLNSGGTPSKRGKVERQMNPQVFINLFLLAAMAVACGIVDSALEHHYYPLGAPWLYGADQPDNNPSINGLITFCFALITFQNIVPISLYISIEFVRTAQAAFIYFDTHMFYEGRPTLARSWNLSDDLGQIEYIFSDKTGTLTQNSMIFRKCTIGGKVYCGVEDQHHHEPEKRVTEVEKTSPRSTSIDAPPAYVKSIASGSDKSGRKEGHLGVDVSPPVQSPSQSQSQSQSSQSGSSGGPPALAPGEAARLPDRASAARPKIIHHFRDSELSRDIMGTFNAEAESSSAAHARHLNGFFTVLGLCHTVLTNLDPETGRLEYKAQSPDEAALVQAAADMGYVFRGRERETLYLQTPFAGANAGADDVASEVKGAGDRDDTVHSSIERYELLNILEFTSARKRMSVVVRKLDGDDRRIFLLTKGADNVIFERLREGSDDMKAKTEKDLDEFASEGLRTLTLAYKVVPEDEYADWSECYHQATLALEHREEKIEEVCEQLEGNLRLLGATAIEDRLQDGVPETIADLKRAGIKIWVATGDKLETAIAIGHSTNLIGRDSNIIVIRGGNGSGRPVTNQMIHAIEQFFPESGPVEDKENLAQSQPTSPGGLRRVDTGVTSLVGAGNGERPGGFILVIDGAALSAALADQANKDLLLRLAILCEGVICCRVSPLQKALVVMLVKDGLQAMTLAIGDGANDVSMIQAADVGVGISGEEGLQAVNSSDYAIAQFRFLKRLLLVHGHWSYARNGSMILNFFYKNIVCIGVLWWFQIYCGWSSNYVFEYTYLLWWNSFWTIAPVIGIGLFDRFVDDNDLMNIPELYRYGREGKWFGIWKFVGYMTDATVQSAIIFFIILYAYFTTSARNDGWQVSMYEFSTVMAISAVMVANAYNGLNTTAWTAWVFFLVFIGDLLIFVYTPIYSSIPPSSFVTPVYGNNHFWYPAPYFYLCVPITFCLALAPRFLYKAWKTGYAPSDIDIIRYIHKTDPTRDLAHDVAVDRRFSALEAMRVPPRSPSVVSHARTESVTSVPMRPSIDPRSGSRTDMSTGIRSVHRGFDFSQEEGGVEIRRIQTNLSERRQSSRNLATIDESHGTLRKRAGTILSAFKRKGSPPPAP